MYKHFNAFVVVSPLIIVYNVYICRMIHNGSVKSAIKITIYDFKTHDQADRSQTVRTGKLKFIHFISHSRCKIHNTHNMCILIHPFLPVEWKMLDMNNRQWLIVVNCTRIMCETVFINWLMFSSLLPIIVTYISLWCYS